MAGGCALASGPRQDLAGEHETGQHGQVATKPSQLHRRESKLSAACSPPPHALLDDPAHQHVMVHVPGNSPSLDNPAHQHVAIHLPRNASWSQKLLSQWKSWLMSPVVGTCGHLWVPAEPRGGGRRRREGKGVQPQPLCTSRSRHCWGLGPALKK